jgi:ABC-type glycerol-3-phosphate transport system substrate-binding protein
MKRQHFLALVVAVSLGAAACGGDGTDSAGAGSGGDGDTVGFATGRIGPAPPGRRQG